MIGGVLRVATPGVPADAPPPEPGMTPWFDGDQAMPVQVGVYQRLSLSGLVMHSYWDGAFWLWNHRSADGAARVPSTSPSLVQNLPWRGLSAPPWGGYRPLPTHTAPQEVAPC